MLIAVDGTYGAEAPLLAARLRLAFGAAVQPFVAPTEAPDPGLAAVLELCPLVVVAPSAPTPWLTELGVRHVIVDAVGEAVAIVGGALDLAAAPAPSKKPLRVSPLDAGSLAEGLRGLGEAWGVEMANGTGIAGVKVELVASFRCDGYAQAADFAHAVAVLAEAQNHHPTLIHDWRTVTVRVATGEAGQRLTERDLRFAAAVDRLAAGTGA
ncbi:MAG: 4a-hydroxytetrahydrobiopterin dehydratase [Geminicoccaceae bacterium]|nr:MAG: 4a-hydroxytetrahydrobiopterin dehydratase [Geminicoccaceae bacterium]